MVLSGCIRVALALCAYLVSFDAVFMKGEEVKEVKCRPESERHCSSPSWMSAVRKLFFFF